MNDVAIRQTGTAVGAVGGGDPFSSYAQAAGADSRPFLKFSKGDWLLGQEDKEIKPGTKFLANMNGILVGWLKWDDGKPVERQMGLLVEGFQAPMRSALGDDDKEKWATDNDGRPRDPWQFSNNLPLKPLDSDEECVFTTSSRGGLQAVARLCGEYGKEFRQRAGMVPVIEIQTDAYNHPNKEYGRIKVPVLKIVEWVAEPGMEDPDAPAPAPEKPAPKKRAGF